ncbi:hypothetical protein ZIOFF_031465 [Zingiber officinale]|uniref:HAT C-terminal dimerisation domain-containing protein n=1 Tax=Zingiber officinale TaxID=94328 RepID=A0A8J5GM02_ZINOF|nr:hypothetical protein ZIOFF_031465 [Zingiber officinale]
MVDSAPAANSAIQVSLDSNEIPEQISDKGDSVNNNVTGDDNLSPKLKKQKRSHVWLEMIDVEDPKGDKYKCMQTLSTIPCKNEDRGRVSNPNDAFDAFGWWKLNTYKFLVLSTLARDILAIPITTVASEVTFSARGRVIDKYRASLARATVEMLMCGRDWCRKRHGVTKKTKVEDGRLKQG